MKVLAIGDEHFEDKNELETSQMCDRIYQVVLEHKPDIIVSLGDALHQHSTLHMGPFKRAINFFHRLSQMCQHLYILVGNHDRPNNTAFLTDDSPFIACKVWDNTTVVDKVFTYKDLIFVPYVPPGRFMEALNTVNITPDNITDYKLIFAHQEFKGSKMGAITSLNGDEYGPTWPLCVSGHIHEYQEPQHNLLYPGTPIQLSYGMPEAKGVLLLDTEDLENRTFIDLGIAKKMIIHLTPEQLATYKPPENCFIKIVCKGDTKVIREITKLESVKEMLQSSRIKLSIQEERKKDNLPAILTKTETIPFQKRLFTAMSEQSDEVKELFKGIFGEY
jgi:DNA repair exonuclease SbcCD nuclease subunit